MMQGIKKRSAWIVLLGLIQGVTWGYVYFEDFSSSNANWQYKFLYSLQAGIHNESHSMTIGPSGGILVFSGDGLSTEYYTELFGFYARYTNVRWSATPEQPFGFEITRTGLALDSDEGLYEESGRKKASFDIGLIEYDPSVVALSNRYRNAIFFSEVYHPKLSGEPNTQPRSFWSLNEAGSPSNAIDFTQLWTPTGTGPDDISGIMNWCYDDNWGQNTKEGTANPGTLNSYSNNNNAIKFRITSDGQYVSLYVNPNPYDSSSQTWNGGSATYKNVFYLVKRVPVMFSNQIMVMVGLANNRGDAERLLLSMDNFTVRTVAASNVAEISPVLTRAGSTNQLKIAVKPWFSSVTEAGVEEIWVKLPDSYLSFTNWTAFTNSIGVFWAETNATQTIYRTFGRTYGDVNPSAGSVSISVKENGGILKIRFNAAASPDVFHPNYSGFGGSIATAHRYMIMIVVSNFFTSPQGDVVGKGIEVYVNNEKYSGTTWDRVATTGPARCYQGDVTRWGTSSQVDNNSLVFRTASDPVGVASIRPNFVYEGESKTWYVDIAAKNTNETADNNADVAHIEILLPAGFTIDPGTIQSSMGLSSSSILYDANQRKITLLYSNENKVLAAGSGNDTVSFVNLATTNLDIPAPGTNQLSNRIFVVSFSDLPGTRPVTNGMSVSYPSQFFLVRKKPPVAEAYQTPRGVKNIYDAVEYSFVIKNRAANTGNNLKRVLIRLDKVITNVVSITPQRPGQVLVSKNITNGNITNSAGYWWILIDYSANNTNIPKDYTETVRFVANDNVASLTNQIFWATNIAYVDNGNGDGWTPAKEDTANLWSYYFYTPFAEVKSAISSPLNEYGVLDAWYNHNHYVDENDPFYFAISVRNSGEMNNTISQVRITFPYGITNVMFPSSFLVSSNSLRLYQTNAGSNWVIEVFYTNKGLFSGSNDVVSCYLMDKIATPTNLAVIVEAKNTTNYVLGENDGADNTELRFIYPHPRAFGAVNVPDGFIDASTNEATISYIISNGGSSENLIKQVYLLIPTNFITNVQWISSSLGGTYGGFVAHTPGYWRFVVNYGNQFAGGITDTITFKVFDRVETEAEFLITANVSNQRMWSNTIAVMPEGTQKVAIIPPPTFYEYALSPTVLYRSYNGRTNTNVILLTVKNRGWGSNRLERLRIILPAALSNQIFRVSNALLGVNASGAAIDFKVLGGTNIVEVNYKLSNTNVPPGMTDAFYLFVAIRTNSLATNWVFVHAANNSTNVDGTPKWTNYYSPVSLQPKTNMLSLVDPPRFFVLPEEVSSPAVSAVYSNRIENGEMNGGRLISAVEFEYPVTFFTNLVVLSTIGNPTVMGTKVRIDYPFGLMPNNGEWVVLRGYDTWNAGDTNFVVNVRVWYTNNEVFTNMAIVRDGYTNRVAFLHPFAQALSFVTPNTVWQDFSSNYYSFVVSNVGGEGNEIRWVKIEIPSFITNLKQITSDFGTQVAQSNGALWVFYSTPIAVGAADRIAFWGFDSIDAGYETNTDWKVWVDNTPTYTKPALAGIYPTKSLTLAILQPGYRASAYLEVTNALSPSNPTMVLTTETNNGLRFYLYNNSDTGNELRYVKITIPAINSLLITNGLNFTNLRTGVTRAMSNGALWFDYSASPLLPTESDELWVNLYDRVWYSNTNVVWVVEAAYNTTDNKFKIVSVQPGRSLTVRYVAPEPRVQVSVNPGEIYFDRKYFSLTMKISNKGASTSAVDQVRVTIPQEFRSGFTLVRISNTTATFTNYASGVVTLGYGTPLAPGQVDTVVLWLSNTTTNVGSWSFPVEVRSFVTNAFAEGQTTLGVSTLPRYFVYVGVNENQREIDTTTLSNRVSIQVVNDITGQIPIKKLRIEYPSIFTNRVQTLSRKVSSAYVSGPATNTLVDYAAGNTMVASGDYDVLQSDLLDGFAVGYSTNEVRVYVQDAWGDLPLPLVNNKKAELYFVMPYPQGVQWGSLSKIYIDTIMSNLTLFVSNTAQTANAISNVKISLPQGLMDIQSVSSLRGSALYRPDDHTIEVSYAIGLNSNQVDQVSFTFMNTYHAPTNLLFTTRAWHLPDHEALLSSLTGESFVVLPVDFPPLAVEGYFVGDNALYIVENEGKLVYRVLNRTYGSEVRRMLFTFATNTLMVFSNIVITNTKATVTRLTTNSNQFLFEYAPGNGIGSQENEDITFIFWYDLTNTGRIPVRSVVDVAAVMSGGTNVSGYETFSLDPAKTVLCITNSIWGIVRGAVFPAHRLVYVKMYQSDGVNIGLDTEGNPLSQAIQLESGEYRMTRVPEGSYVLELSAPVYRVLRTNIFVPANQTVRVGVLSMRNAPLIGNEDEVQVVECYEDTNTMVVFPGQAVGREFSVDITREPFTVPQKRNLSENKTVKSPSSAENMYGYRMRLATRDDKPMDGAVVKRDAILYLAYDGADIVSRGWSEDELAIYYWDDNGANPRWVRVGGEVDKTAKRVIAKVGYVHSFYAVLAKSGEDRPGVITAVTLRPKVFTPSRSGDGYYGSVRVTIEFRQAVERYEVKIFDLKGNLVRRFIRTDGPYTQGEVAWDGKDTEGYDVKNGVYVYKIYANGETYSGTLVIAR